MGVKDSRCGGGLVQAVPRVDECVRKSGPEAIWLEHWRGWEDGGIEFRLVGCGLNNATNSKPADSFSGGNFSAQASHSTFNSLQNLGHRPLERGNASRACGRIPDGRGRRRIFGLRGRVLPRQISGHERRLSAVRRRRQPSAAAGLAGGPLPRDAERSSGRQCLVARRADLWWTCWLIPSPVATLWQRERASARQKDE